MHAWVLLPILLALNACSRAKVDLRKDVPAAVVPSSGPRVYSEFWEAAENLQTDRAIQLAANEEQKSLSQALERIQGGETDRAIAMLVPLQQSKDPRMAKAAGDLVRSLLTSESRWSELAVTDKGNKVVQVYGSLPPETCSIPDHESVFSVDFNGGRTPLLEIEINGVKRKFLVDTGAGLTVISSETAQAGGLQAMGGVPQATAGTSTNRRVEFKPASVDRLAIGKIQIRNHPVMIIDAKALKMRVFGITFSKIDGILGWNAIRRFRMVVDYPNRTLSISRSNGTNAGKRNFFHLGSPIVQARAIDGTPVFLGVDSGAKYSHFHTNIIEKLKIKGSQVTRTWTWGVGGFGTLAAVTVPETTLVLGDFSLTFRQHKATEKGIGVFARMDGVLGNNLNARRLILDYPAGQFLLE